MGVTRVEVVMAEWDVELAVLSMRQRPDVVARRLQRKRMTYAQQILEAAKTDPEMVRAIPPGTVEMPPVDRAVELDRLVAGKFDEMQRKAEAEHPPEPVKERKKSRAEEEREIAADRAWSDAMAEEVYREAQAARAGSVK